MAVSGLPKPKEDGLAGMDGIVTSRVVGKGCLLEVFHEDIRQWAAGRFAHAKTLELLVEATTPLEVG